MAVGNSNVVLNGLFRGSYLTTAYCDYFLICTLNIFLLTYLPTQVNSAWPSLRG